MTDYATLDDLKRFLRIPGVYEGTYNQTPDLYDDIVLQGALTAASRTIDHATKRTFGTVGENAEARIFLPEWNSYLRRWVVYFDDFTDTDDLIVKTRAFPDTAFDNTLTDYTLYPLNANGSPYTYLTSKYSLGDAVEVTAKYGWTETPEPIKYATLLQASRFFKRRDAPFGIAGSADTGSEMRLFAKVDPDVQLILTPYKRAWGAV